MEIARWVLTALLGLAWLGLAATNANLFFGRAQGEGVRRPSMVPLAGGLVALLAVAVCPVESKQKWWAAAAVLLLDMGSAPYLVMALIALTRQALGEPGSVRGWFKRWLAQLSWGYKFALGTVGWLGALLLTFLVWDLVKAGVASPATPFWVTSVLYWVVYVWLMARLKKSQGAASE